MGLIGFIGFIGFTGFILFIGFVGFIGLRGFIGFVGVYSFLAQPVLKGKCGAEGGARIPRRIPIKSHDFISIFPPFLNPSP